MTSTRKNVVPFERPAAYWTARAKRHDTPAKMPSAARLMRKALEKEHDPETALELTRMELSMGCVTAAERLLLSAAGWGGLSGGICFHIACCALEQEDENLAQQALEAALRLEPEGLYADQAQDLLETYPWSWGETLPRGARSECLCMRARAQITRGQLALARKTLKKAWRRGKSADAAMLLGSLEPDTFKRVLYFTYAVRHQPGELRPLLLLARALHQAGRGESVPSLLGQAAGLCEKLSQTEFFCAAAWDTGYPDAARALLSEKLAESPFSVDVMRLQYLTCKRLGREEEAQALLARMRQIDPEDASALRYARDPRDISPDEHRMVYLVLLSLPLRLLPGRLREGPLNRTLHLMTMAMRERMTEKEVYHYLPPLWRRLSRGEKRAADEQDPAVLSAMSLFLLLQTGRGGTAREMLRKMPERHYIRRKTERYLALYDKGGKRTHALYQF